MVGDDDWGGGGRLGMTIGEVSKRLPSKDKSSTLPRVSGFSHSSWIREMQQASNKSIIIREILDSRTRNLVSVTKISDYVLSNELVSMALAMVAEDKKINCVLEELFAEEGNKMCIKPLKEMNLRTIF
ncbi:CASTOR/POLLUX/SYM8 ion channel protein [Artemisia annua]|uniref:CASTOR/POLLUX/SYM8 ion channel protein n=1 Tax=Artemisia annua TaxID=35608 RepID=A0A2U1MYI9_ARTAN|nr:CASTOR/POLLUX/SYM8 ion channel protein [Artemisia annua]